MTHKHPDGYPGTTRISGVTPYKKRRLKSPKSKGDNFERELAEYLNQAIPGLTSHRAPLSGGGFSFARSIAPTADLTGTPHLWVEAKRVEKLNFHEAMAQAVKGSSAHNSVDIPVVVSRRNRQTMDTSLVTLQLKDFLKLYRALLGPCKTFSEALSSKLDTQPNTEKELSPCQPSSSSPSSPSEQPLTSSPPTQLPSKQDFTPPSPSGPIP